MKFSLPVDAGYFFDYISILSVKYDKFGNKSVLDDLANCSDSMRNAIGGKKFDEITKSKEYIELYDANSLVFDYVDLAKTNKVTAKEVDEMNYQRFLKKKALQEKFFPNTTFGEKKYGY